MMLDVSECIFGSLGKSEAIYLVGLIRLVAAKWLELRSATGRRRGGLQTDVWDRRR
jgi:hypothetical protein